MREAADHFRVAILAALVGTTDEPIDQSRAALARRGIVPTDGEVIADGCIPRCEAQVRAGKVDAAGFRFAWRDARDPVDGIGGAR
jgi:hypothetical protein